MYQMHKYQQRTQGKKEANANTHTYAYTLPIEVCARVVIYKYTCQHVCVCINIDAYISDACKSHTNISDA